MTLLEVDGSAGEGGGQILRTALSLAAVTGQAVRVHNIRAGRPKPGLARQHLTAVKALVDLCRAKAEGVALGSTEVLFRPGDLHGGHYGWDVGTAGSVTLVLQACILPAALAREPTSLVVRGGTDVPWSPPADYFLHVFLEILRRMGVEVEMRVIKRGYYPKGGGMVEVLVEPGGPKPLQVPKPGQVHSIHGWAHVSNLPGHIAQRMRTSAVDRLAGFHSVSAEDIALQEGQALGPGGAIVLRAETENALLGSSALAEKGVKAERLGEGAADSLLADLRAEATLDVHAADQLLPYMAIAQGMSTFVVREVSSHLKTLFWLLPKFLDVDFLEESREGAVRVEIRPTRT